MSAMLCSYWLCMVFNHQPRLVYAIDIYTVISINADFAKNVSVNVHINLYIRHYSKEYLCKIAPCHVTFAVAFVSVFSNSLLGKPNLYHTKIKFYLIRVSVSHIHTHIYLFHECILAINIFFHQLFGYAQRLRE